jgi:hypothetical protein
LIREILEALVADLKIRGVLDGEESFIDGSFAPAKKGVPRSAKQNVVKDQRSWLSPTAMVSPFPSVSSVLHLTK